MAAPGNTVVVACKLPHGLVLRLYDMVDFDEPAAGGGYRTVKRARPRPEQFVLRGYLTKYRGSKLQPIAETSSFAYTEGVGKEFFDEWLKQNRDNPVVVNGLIFSAEKPEAVRGFAKEHAKLRNGLEPIDPARLPRNVQTADEQKKIEA